MSRTKARYPTTPTLEKRGENWHYSFSFLGKRYRGSTYCNKKGKAQIESETDCMLITGHKSRSVFDKFYNVIEAKDVFTAIQNSKKVMPTKSDNVLPINIKKVDV